MERPGEAVSHPQSPKQTFWNSNQGREKNTQKNVIRPTRRLKIKPAEWQGQKACKAGNNVHASRQAPVQAEHEAEEEGSSQGSVPTPPVREPL